MLEERGFICSKEGLASREREREREREEAWLVDWFCLGVTLCNSRSGWAGRVREGEVRQNHSQEKKRSPERTET